MSALPAQTGPARRLVPSPARRLRPAPEPSARRAPRLVYAVVALGSIGVIAIVQLLLSIAMTQGAYELDAQLQRQAQLQREQQKLADDLDRLQSPQFLAANAEALGMVPNTDPVMLRLSNGAVIGDPTAAEAGTGSSSSLVPNALISGVPLVTERGGEQTAKGEAGKPAEAADGAPAAPAPPPVVTDGLPTPATH
ncbi:hypothetical protein [Agromyces marinus]|uniref:Cell division protein FtsL n=1 Tax=Agromyces marinus TaxID=1389020 RepID=A0ABM8GXU0_9MICO|nr:hypothetical protein [Agromyces marinus]UIP58425.1 hypothetical protein DSM26151_13000 [Agromyces marinus]BDZ53318.1 hypothetical protein GCM10025870_03910 [Agromyces marinus]